MFSKRDIVNITVLPIWLSSGKYFLRVYNDIIFQLIFINIESLSFELIETGNPKIQAHKQAYLLLYLDWKVKKLN